MAWIISRYIKWPIAWKQKKWQQEVCLKLHATTKPVPVDLGKAIEGGNSGQRNIYSVERNFLIFSRDSCLVRDWTGSLTEKYTEDGVTVFKLENAMSSNMALTFHIDKEERSVAFVCVCCLQESLKEKLFADIPTPVAMFFWLWDEALVISDEEEGRSLYSHWKYESSHIWRIGPHPGLIVSILWHFSLSWESTWKLSEQTHRGLVTLGWTPAGSSQTQLSGSHKVKGTLIPIVSTNLPEVSRPPKC